MAQKTNHLLSYLNSLAASAATCDVTEWGPDDARILGEIHDALITTFDARKQLSKDARRDLMRLQAAFLDVLVVPGASLVLNPAIIGSMVSWVADILDPDEPEHVHEFAQAYCRYLTREMVFADERADESALADDESA